MRIGETLRALPRVPVRHIVFAIVCGAAVGVGFWVWSRSLATEYVMSALLSYDTPHRFLSASPSPQSDDSTVQIAQSILSPQLLKKLAAKSQLPSSASSDGVASTDTDNFRSHLELTQPAPGLLQMTYRDLNEKQVAAAMDLLTNALTSWTPEPDAQPVSATVPAAKDPSVVAAASGLPASSPAPPSNVPVQSPGSKPGLSAAQTEHRIAALREDSATLALQQKEIEHRIFALNQQRRGMEFAQNSNAGFQARSEQRSPAAASHDLAKLRDIRAELITQQQANAARMEKLKERADGIDQIPSPAGISSEVPAPQPSPVPAPPAISNPEPQKVSQETAQPADTHPVAKGSFSIIEGGGRPRAVGNEEKLRILSLGAVAAVLSTLIYLLVAGWRFRPVTDLESLRHVLPLHARYLGAVAGSPLTEEKTS